VHVIEIRQSGSRITYDVEDGSSGRLKAVQFLGPESSTLPEESLKEHIYVRLMGRLRVFNGRNELKVMHDRPVHDVHEPFFHCLDAMVSFLAKQKQYLPAPPTQEPPTPNASQSPQGMQPGVTDLRTETDKGTEDEEFGPDFFETTFGEIIDLEEIDRLTLVDSHPDEDQHKLDSGTTHQPATNPLLETKNQTSLIQDPYSSLSPLQRDILIQIQENSPFFPDGVPIKALYRRTGRSIDRYSELHIRQAIKNMMDDYLLYSTIDENHFKMVD